MATARVGGLRADITARDTGFQQAVTRTVRSLNRVQATSARVNRSFATQASTARRVTRSYNLVASAQQAVTRASRAMTAVTNINIAAIRSAITSMFRWVASLNLARLSTIALNATTAILSGNLLEAARTAAAFLGPQAALAAAAIGTGAALFRISNSSDAAAAGIERLSGVTARFNAVINRLTSAAVIVGLATAAGQLVRSFTNAVDSITNLRNRIALVSTAGEDAADTLERLRRVAESTRTSLRSTGEIYTRLAEALQGAIPTNELLNVVETIQRAVVLSGVSAQSSDAALTQLAQGLAAGALRGEELNSVLEQLPRVTRVLTDELGVTIGQLRDMAEAGQITNEVITRAFTNQASRVQEEFAQQATTVDQALTVASDKFVTLLDSLNRSVGLTRIILGGITVLTTLFEGWEIIFTAIGDGVKSVAEIIQRIANQGPAQQVQVIAGTGSAQEVRDLREEYDNLTNSIPQLERAEESLAVQVRAANNLIRDQRDILSNIGDIPSGFSFGAVRFGARVVTERRLDDLLEKARPLQEAYGNISDQLDTQRTRYAEVTEELQSFGLEVDRTKFVLDELARTNPNVLLTIEELDDALTIDQWSAYTDGINEAADAIDTFSDKYRRSLEHNERVRMNIDQLDSAIDDETHLRRINALLENNAQISEFFKEEVVETVDEYARWIANQQRLNAEFQKAIDLGVAAVGEDIAGRILFGINQQFEPVIQNIDQLDEALTDSQWETYAAAVRDATSAVAAFRADQGTNLGFVRSDRENLEIDQLDALLGDEQHLQYIQELLRQSGQIAEHFKVEVEEIVDEYANWIAEQQRLNEEFQKLADDELSDVGERIAGSINFAEMSVVELSGALEDLDAALTDEQWIAYRDAVEEARIAIEDFYETRKRTISNPEELTIDQLNARLDDETHLEHIQQILSDNADIARFFTQETKATVSEYDRWIERMRELHQAAQDTRDLAVARTAEELAGAITFNAASRLSADQQTIEELDAALTDEQWIQYREAVDAAAESIDQFREKNKSAFELLTEDVREFAMALGDNIAQSLGDAIAGVTSFGDAFRNVASFIIRRLIQMTLEATLFQNALSSGGAGGGGLGGIFRNILSLFGGGTGGFQGPHRQLGGPVSAGRSYVVGEAGPEIFSPGTSGSIIPNSQIGGGGIGNLTIQVNGVQDPTIVRSEILNALPIITREVKGEITSGSIRPSQTRRSLRVAVA